MNRGSPRTSDSGRRGEAHLVHAAWSQFEQITGGKRDDPPIAHRFPGIPGYRILGEIHRGGQGIVYQAIQESTHRKIAVKVLKRGPFADRIELARFEREVDVLSRLNNPHIVAIHDRGLTDGHAYYVMDYIAGKPLDAYVRGAQLSSDEILSVFASICEAVNVAHLRGVIHRDLKPGNILIDFDGQPRILDFGLAKLEEKVAGSSSAAGMTITGQFVGSLPWASPEQAEGQSESIDIRSDVYSLGVILYQLLMNRFPYAVTGKVFEVVRNITQAAPARPSSIQGAIDSELELIVLKCLAKEPVQRYQSAGELARDIRLHLADEPILATPPGTVIRLRKFIRRNRGLVLAVAAIAATLIVATGVSVSFAIREARQRAAAEDARQRAVQAEADAKARARDLEQVAKFQEAQLSGIDAKNMGEKLRAGLIQKARTAAERTKLSDEELSTRARELESLIAGSDFTGLALDALNENVFQRARSAID
ncbi:MAG TPA: serine/threonine-protein kinase, partial [Phycisphaerae bacterium]|nr:serine/threonine-protein kinase [Phycisphaerae bacterium]